MSEDYSYFDFVSVRGGREKMNANQCSLNFTKHTRGITINQEVTRYLSERNLNKVRIRYDNITGDVCLVFNREIGTIITKSGRKNFNFCIFNKKFAEKIAELLNLPLSEHTILNLGNNTSRNDICACYRIYK